MIKSEKKSQTKSWKRNFYWVNSQTKEVRLPDELTAAIKKNKKPEVYFHALAFSHKKKYIEWMVTAKRDETKAQRIKGKIERLIIGWKNPRNE